ncbi:MAG: hypothetical protein HDR02_04800 [Lachnospiraceae bacterium]|nr:hypothetical protein [Lachnospiraceae bacterium]
MSNNYENKYSLSAIIQLLNPDNTISAHRMLAHAIGMTETIIYSALISKQTYYLNNNMLHDGGWFFSTIADLQESTTFGAKAQKTAIGNLIKHGLIECECKGMPAKRYFRITNDMEILMKLIDEGTEICKKISAKANRNSYENDEISNENSYEKSEILEDIESVENVEKSVQTAEKLQYLPKAVTNEGAQSSCPSAVTCTRPADNHTIKPKINNLKCNQSINQTDRLISAPMKFSDIMENLGLDWYTLTANEPISEKHFMYRDEIDRKTQKCKISYSLKNDKRNMKAALRYLCAYSHYFGEGNDEERRSLWETIVTALAEMVEPDSIKINGRTVMYHEIIDRLNEIIENSYLSECFIGFEEHWRTLVAKKEITYPKAYMKSCLWNWLCDFEFEDFNDLQK